MSKQEPHEMFRKEALEHLSSPEQLDQLLQVVTRKSWVPITTLAGGLIAAVVWAIVGHIPVTVEGKGLLVYPHRTVPFQAPTSGQIVALDIKVGDQVRKHQVLGRIKQPELEQRLAQERIRLREFEAREREARPLRDQRLNLERRAIQSHRLTLQRRIETTTQTANEQKEKSDKYFAQQDENLARLKTVTEELGQAVRAQFARVQELMSRGMATELEVLDAQRDYIDNRLKLADLELRGHEVALRRIAAESSYLKQMDLVADLKSELQELEIESAKLDQRQIETEFESKQQIEEIKRRIARYEEQLLTKGRIVSEYSGRILEVAGTVGQFIREGQRLGAIEAEDLESKLVAVVYYSASDGKKIDPGMDSRITPTTVQRERYGSIIGSVTTVSSYPVTTDAVTNVVGNAEVAERLTAGGDKIEVRCAIERDPSSPTGFRWTSGRGPEVEITAGTPLVVRTTIEYRRPISYIIPVLRRWSGS